MSADLPPDLTCPKCGEMRQIRSSEDDLHWECDVCTYHWGKDRPALNENDRRMLSRHHRQLDGTPKPR